MSALGDYARERVSVRSDVLVTGPVIRTLLGELQGERAAALQISEHSE